ncbi:MAG: fibronectin type III domain-containing protein [Planctomycetota bacterium]|nr:fibronectin type III domain-containing protein [Planctomycetota bacterium]
MSVLSEKACEAVIEYGVKADALSSRTAAKTLRAGVPTKFEITGLEPDRAYVYRVRTRAAGAAGGAGTEAGYETRTEASFRTRRAAREGFTFCVQGDSHPERLGRMYDPELYARALRNVAADKPDFYFMMGDDFSIERLIERGTKSQDPEARGGVE